MLCVGYSLVAVFGLLVAVASLAAEPRLQAAAACRLSIGSLTLEHRLNSYGAQA